MERQFSCPQFFGVRSQNKVKYLPGEQQKFDEIRVFIGDVRILCIVIVLQQ